MASLSFSSFQTLFPKPCRHCNAIPNFGLKSLTGFRIFSGIRHWLRFRSFSVRRSRPHFICREVRRKHVLRFGNARKTVIENTRSSSDQAVPRSVRRKRRKKVEEGVVSDKVLASGSSLISGDEYIHGVDGVMTGSVSSRIDSEDEPKGSDIDGVEIGSVSSETDLKVEAKGIDVNGVTTGSRSQELASEVKAKDSFVDGVGTVSSELDLEDEVKESDIDEVSRGYVTSQIDLEDEANNNDVYGVVTGSVSFKLDLDEKKDRNPDGAVTGSITLKLDMGAGAKHNGI